MTRRLRSRTALAVVAVLAIAATAVTAWLVLRGPAAGLAQAVAWLPEDTAKVSFTDWSAVSAAAGGSDLTARSDAASYEAFLDRAYERDLTSGSALTTSFPALADAFGLTPLDAEWEAYGQSTTGSVDLLRLGPEVDLASLEERIADLGWTEPTGGPGSGGAWVGTPELIVGLDEPLTPLQENLAVLREERVLVMSDAPEYVEAAVAVVRGDDAVAGVAGVNDLVQAAGTPASALLWVGDFACGDLALTQADSRDIRAGRALVEAVGGVNPLGGLLVAVSPALDEVTVAMVFDSEDQASDDLQARADLAAGPAPGQGGTFAERFRVVDAVADGPVVRLTLDPAAGARVLGDLGQGPVLFAAC